VYPKHTQNSYALCVLPYGSAFATLPYRLRFGSVVIAENVWRSYKILFWLLLIITIRLSLPFDKIFLLPFALSVLEDCFDLIFWNRVVL
jgi:hypothetical protein